MAFATKHDEISRLFGQRLRTGNQSSQTNIKQLLTDKIAVNRTQSTRQKCSYQTLSYIIASIVSKFHNKLITITRKVESASEWRFLYKTLTLKD